MTTYRIQTSASPALHVPFVDDECERISIILGANGSGKTSLLNHIIHKRVVDGINNYVNFEGTRIIGDNLHSLQIDHTNYEHFHNMEKAETTYKNQRGAHLTHRIKASLIMINLRSAKQKEEYLLSLAKWDREGRNEASPVEPSYLLDQLFFLYQLIFPNIKIRITPENRLIFSQQGEEYVPISASEGERQVLALLVDLLLHVEEDFLVIVDEPEAHLNPLLACQVWDAIEEHLPRVQFIYTTHCVAFAMRPCKKTLFIIKKLERSAEKIDALKSLSAEELRQFLGAIPLILASQYALAIEGEQDSFDNFFYRWIINRNDVSIVPIGNCTDVLSETARIKLWESLAPSAKIVGVIDRDFRGDQFIADQEKIGAVVLQYHEAESYLCHPDLIVAAVQKATGQVIEQATIKDLIFSFAKEQMMRTVIKRVSAAIDFNSGVSLSRSDSADITDSSSVTEKFNDAVKVRLTELTAILSAHQIDALVRKSEAELSDAIERQDVDAILKLIPGKQLLNQLIKITGLQSNKILMSAITHHLSPDDFPFTKLLRDRLISRFV